MENILIIGNGFDLYHGLPTRYTDFLSFAALWRYFKGKFDLNPLKSNFESDGFIVRLGENGTITQESMEDFADYRLCFDRNKIEYLDRHLKTNLWIKYFRATDYKKEGWIDFEREIETVLFALHYLTTNTVNVTSYYYKIKLFAEKINRKMEDFDRGKQVPEDLSKNKRNILNCMKKELDELNKCLYIYLSEFVSRVKIQKYSRQISELPQFTYDQIKPHEEIKVLTFNYTNTYQKVYNQSYISGCKEKMHFVHGDLSEYADDNSKGLVLGIRDESGLSDDYIYFKKFFQRIQKRTGNNYREWIFKSRLYNENVTYCVHVFGHSLDITDKGILDFFFTNQSVRKVIIYFNDQKSYERQVINLVEMYGKDEIIEKIANGRIFFLQIEESIPLDTTASKE